MLKEWTTKTFGLTVFMDPNTNISRTVRTSLGCSLPLLKKLKHSWMRRRQIYVCKPFSWEVTKTIAWLVILEEIKINWAMLFRFICLITVKFFTIEMAGITLAYLLQQERFSTVLSEFFCHSLSESSPSALDRIRAMKVHEQSKVEKLSYTSTFVGGGWRPANSQIQRLY